MWKPDIEAFIEQPNLHHPTIKFTAETFDTETAFLDTAIYKGTRVKEKSILDKNLCYIALSVRSIFNSYGAKYAA